MYLPTQSGLPICSGSPTGLVCEKCKSKITFGTYHDSSLCIWPVSCFGQNENKSLTENCLTCQDDPSCAGLLTELNEDFSCLNDTGLQNVSKVDVLDPLCEVIGFKSASEECEDNVLDAYVQWGFSNGHLTYGVSGLGSAPSGQCSGSSHMKYKLRKIHNSERNFTSDCKACSLLCSGSELSIHSPFHTIRSTIITSRNDRVYSSENGKVVKIELSPSMLSLPGPVTVELWMDDKPESLMTHVDCSSVDFCAQYRGWVEPKILWNPSCLLKATSTVVMTTLIGILSFLFTVLIVLSILKLVFLLLISLLRVLRYTIFGSWYILSKRTQSKRFNRRNLIDPRLIVAIILCSAVDITRADYQAYSKLPSSDCVFSKGGKATCSTSFKSRLVISPVGQESNLLFNATNDSNFGYIRIKTESLLLKCVKRSLYYTMDLGQSLELKTNCKDAGGCNEDACMKFGTSLSTMAFSDWNETKMGHKECSYQYVEGWPLKGCILKRMCIWAWIKFQTDESSVGEVFNCPEWEYEVHISYELSFGGRPINGSAVLIPSSLIMIQGSGISLGVASLYSPPLPLLSRCFLDIGGAFSSVKCNDPGNLLSGRIGEVQCPSRKDAEMASSKCLYAQGISKLKASGETAILVLNQHSISKASIQSILPQSFEGLTLEDESGVIIAKETGISGMEIDLSGKNVTIVMKVDKISCSFKFLSLSGCYSCGGAAVLSISSLTEWGEGLATVTCPDIFFQSTIWLTEREKVYNLSMVSNVAEVDTKCHMKCSGSDHEARVFGTLRYIPPEDLSNVRFLNETIKSDGGISFSLPILNLGDWIKGLMLYIPWKEMLLLATVIVVVLSLAWFWLNYRMKGVVTRKLV